MKKVMTLGTCFEPRITRINRFLSIYKIRVIRGSSLHRIKHFLRFPTRLGQL
jgi:hypothetical protein